MVSARILPQQRADIAICLYRAASVIREAFG